MDVPFFSFVATEYAFGKYMGADYGSRIRVLMRSPTHVIYVAYGVNLVHRASSSQGGVKALAQKATIANLDRVEVRQKIVAAFGEGADDAAIQAVRKRGLGTVLVDGGGVPLPLPMVQQREQFEHDYAALTATRKGLIPIAGKCRQCGSDLTPELNYHHLKPVPDDPGHPKTVEDCQRLTNHPIMSVHGYSGSSDREWWPFIDWFSTWDGESYRDPFFCTDACAAKYGRRAVVELPLLSQGGEPPARKRFEREYISHYEQPVIITESGLRL